jgi:hypothetical protein
MYDGRRADVDRHISGVVTLRMADRCCSHAGLEAAIRDDADPASQAPRERASSAHVTSAFPQSQVRARDGGAGHPQVQRGARREDASGSEQATSAP